MRNLKYISVDLYRVLLALALLALALLASGCVTDKAATDNGDKSAIALDKQTKATSALISEKLPHYLSRDIKDEIFYFVMPDRFSNGDKSNDLGDKNKPESYGGLDAKHKGFYHGGDLKGLKNKLSYLQEMGVTAIWMTPIMRNQAVQDDSSGYHGYWVLDFTEIDPHLGSNQDLIDLINDAHQRNMKVFFDIIVNHTADVIQYQECHGRAAAKQAKTGDCPYKSLQQLREGDRYTPYIVKEKQQIKVPAWLNETKYYHNQGDSDWVGESALNGDFAGLDDIDTDNPEVVKGMVDIFKNVISEFKPDGFRIDTVKHVNIEFWQVFSPEILKYAKAQGIEQFFMFGEVYDPDPENLSVYVNDGQLQSVLDFGLQSTISQVLIDNQGTDKLAQLFSQDHLYQGKYGDSSTLVNFTGNHDMGRFAFLLKTKHPNMPEDELIARIKLANALMFFSRGIPVIYYGDEQGFIGDGNDQDARQDMMPSHVASYNDDQLIATSLTTADDNFDQQHIFYQDYLKLASIYQAHPALRHGHQQVVFSQAKAGAFVFTRTLAPTEQKQAEKAIIVVNTSAENIEQTIDINSEDFETVVSATKQTAADNQLTLSLAPFSFAIYKSRF